MNVLLVTFSFPPAGGVGVLRALSLAKYLPSEGMRVDVLTARNAPAVGRDLSLLAQVPAEVTVHRTWTLDLPFGLRKGIKKLLSRGSAPKRLPAASVNPANGGAARQRSFVGMIRSAVANLLLPDPQIGWIPFAYLAAKRIIRSRSIDAVLITVPPFSSVKLARMLRRAFPALPIVIDFRDEWLTTTLHLVSLNDNRRARRVAEKTEREAVEASSAVVLVTEAAKRELQQRYSAEPAGKFHCISNGFDGPWPINARTSPPATPKSEVTITYVGSIYGSTDPTTFVQAVLSLPPEIRSALRIRFVGHIETQHYRDTLSRLEETVQIVGFLPQAEALELLDTSDYVLLLSHDPINISAKLYDYLGSGRPILAAIHPEGNIRSRLKETRTGWWADIRDAEAIQRMLAEAVERVQKGDFTLQPNIAAIARYHRRPLAHEYAELLRNLKGNAAA